MASEAFHWQTGPVCIRVPEDQTRAVVPGATLDDDLGRPAVQVVQQKGAWHFPGQYRNGDSLSARTPAWASVRIKCSDDAANLVTSDDFLNELESELGLPQKGETEDEFVARAKASMFEMLKAKLK